MMQTVGAAMQTKDQTENPGETVDPGVSHAELVQLREKLRELKTKVKQLEQKQKEDTEEREKSKAREQRLMKDLAKKTTAVKPK